MTAIRRGDGTALWRQIAEALAADIRAERVPRDRPLPPESALAARFAVNRHTVRRALAALADDGLIRTEQGRGSFVQDVILDYPLRSRTSFSANLLEQDRVPTHRIIAVEETRADERVARLLEVPKNAPLVLVTSVGEADGVPITFSRSFLPIDRLPGLLDTLSRETSMTRIYEACGVRTYRRRSTRITARLPSAEEARHLRQAAHLPVLLTDAVDVDEEERPIRTGTACFAAARVQLAVEKHR